MGAICCRVENDTTTGENKLYILTLAVLPVYRRRQVGSQLLESVLEEARNWNDKKQGQNDPSMLISSIYLHVQLSNDTACAFYRRHGFQEGAEIVENYYKRIEPADAYIYSLDLLGSVDGDASGSEEKEGVRKEGR